VSGEEYTHDQSVLERAISTDDADRAAKIIQNALGFESDEVANYSASQNLSKGP
jgi:hypothetical protein